MADVSKYFLWYLILIPFYLPYSSFLSSPRLGVTAALLWVGSQVSSPSALKHPLIQVVDLDERHYGYSKPTTSSSSVSALSSRGSISAVSFSSR